MLPLSGTLQLTAAYVPVIWFPATVAVTWKGQLIGTLGVSVCPTALFRMERM